MKNKFFQSLDSKPKLLVVGMIDSIHLERWLVEVKKMDIFGSIYIFPSTTPKRPPSIFRLSSGSRVHLIAPPDFFGVSGLIYSLFDRLFQSKWRELFLEVSIKTIRPRIVHVHEIQHAGYIYGYRRKKNQALICSTWGSDLILYGKLDSHENRISNFLSQVDFLLAERKEDESIAKKLGFSGKAFIPNYATLGAIDTAGSLPDASLRNVIVVKGYQDNSGRALNALQALELIHSDLSSFEVIIISASEPVKIQAELLKSSYSMNIKCLEKVSHEAVIDLFKSARVYLGLSISDGISNTMVEAMQFGALPIQSENSSAKEFIADGVSGFIVNPWDIQLISKILRESLLDIEFLNQAMIINRNVIQKRFNRDIGITKLRDLYISIFGSALGDK
jgi:glycosyltransferase involved in cell wall biosynthesis